MKYPFKKFFKLEAIPLPLWVLLYVFRYSLRINSAVRALRTETGLGKFNKGKIYLSIPVSFEEIWKATHDKRRGEEILSGEEDKSE